MTPDTEACFGMLPVEEVVVEETAVDWLTNISLEPESTTGLVGEETRGVAFALGVTSMNFVIGCLSSRLALFPPGLPTHCSNAFWVSPDTAMEGPRGTVTGLVGEKGTWGFTARGLGDVMAWTSLAGGGREVGPGPRFRARVTMPPAGARPGEACRVGVEGVVEAGVGRRAGPGEGMLGPEGADLH